MNGKNLICNSNNNQFAWTFVSTINSSNRLEIMIYLPFFVNILFFNLFL
jgi:hypothetical protein